LARVDSPEHAEPLGFVGSPTILVNVEPCIRAVLSRLRASRRGRRFSGDRSASSRPIRAGVSGETIQRIREHPCIRATYHSIEVGVAGRRSAVEAPRVRLLWIRDGRRRTTKHLTPSAKATGAKMNRSAALGEAKVAPADMNESTTRIQVARLANARPNGKNRRQVNALQHDQGREAPQHRADSRPGFA
jgi:hypothetical protein